MYKIKKILPIADFKLVLEYSDGVSIVADFIPIIQQGKVFQPFQPLRDPNFFAKVSLDNTGRYIYWEGEIEFCADALRMKGKVIDEDCCLNQAMDEGKNTPLYPRAESLAFLED
ncbi:MAG: DUF2442 domain-containing protein [Prochlorotrichaceae cyanobacterium]|jgi:hypothetical protein